MVYFISLVVSIPKSIVCGIYSILIIPYIIHIFRAKVDKVEMIVFLYMAYLLLSAVFLSGDEYYLSYLNSINVSFIPILFFFYAKIDSEGNFLYKFYRAISITLMICLVLYYLSPQFYISGLYKNLIISKEHIDWMQAVFTSVFGVTIAGFYSGVCYLYFFVKFLKNEKTIQSFLLSFIMILILILTFRRGAWLAAIVISLLIIFKEYIIAKRISLGKVINMVIVVAVVQLAMWILPVDTIIRIIDRVAQFSDAVGERSSSWEYALDYVYNPLFGNGFGSFSHYLNDYYFPTVNDSYYYLLYAENGIFGLMCFFIITLICLRRGLENYDTVYPAIIIVLFALVQNIGSNMLEFQAVSPIFWYSVGICWFRNKKGLCKL